MVDFIQEYFVNPIIHPDAYAPYNVYNTVVYAVIAIAAVYLIYRILEKKGVLFDERFFKSILPFIFFGSVLRIAEDGGILPRVVEIAGIKIFPFVTPGIYILTFFLLVLTWFIARKTSKTHEEFCWQTLAVGAVLSALAILASLPVLVKAQNPLAFAGIIALALGAWFAFKMLWKHREKQTTFPEEAVVFSQALDGSATFAGVQFLGYSEQHIVGNAIFALFGGPWAFLLVKIIFALVVVELVRRENIKEGEKNYLLLLITILGLAPGLRDAFRILAGV